MIDRRVAGVLVEKAKTTPEAYPLSLNAVRTACNQKNNRFPVMELEAEQVQQSLDHLRSLGAVSLVQGGGRVERFRHQLYDWLGVDKVELAVMAELLLRGAQTEGELRGRAARMEPIADLAALRPILDSLAAKNLIVSLSPPGRGHVLSHNLYPPEELERLRAQYSGRGGSLHVGQAAVAPHAAVSATHDQAGADARPTVIDADDLRQLRQELADLRETVGRLEAQTKDLHAELQQLKQSLGA